MRSMLPKSISSIMRALRPAFLGGGSGSMSAAGTLLPPVAPVKPPKPGGMSFPGHAKSIATSSALVPKQAFEVANVDLTSTYRNGNNTSDIVSKLVRFSPELGAAVAANTRVGIPEKFIAIARDPDGTFNRDATQLALQLLRQMNTMPDYLNGFSHVSSLRSVSEAEAKQMQEHGAMALELVLDKNRLPLQFRPVPVSSIIWYDEDKGLNPYQKVGGDEVSLDIPTFFYVSLDASLTDVYARSPLEAAVQPVLASTTFLSDMRRMCARHVYQRYDIVIDEEKLGDRIPQDVRHDEEKLTNYLNAIVAEIDQAITNLGLEEAIIHYDYFTIKYVESSGNDMPAAFTTVNSVLNNKVATAARTPPSVLGLGAASQSISSSETLIFMINANGMIRLKLQELYSKALTMAVRLFGLDVTVEFEFDDIELRPASELEAYKAMYQSRILTQLSFGFIGDDEAGLRLTGQLPPVGFKPLSGTMFSVTPTAAPVDNGNNTSTTGTMDQNKAPEAAPGSKKK